MAVIIRTGHVRRKAASASLRVWPSSSCAVGAGVSGTPTPGSAVRAQRRPRAPGRRSGPPSRSRTPARGVSANWKRSRSFHAMAPFSANASRLMTLLPVARSVNDDGDLLGQLPRLRQGEQLEHLVQGAESAGKDHQCLGQIREPELAHEKVVELEVQAGRDVGVGHLLEGQFDVEADGLAPAS